MGATQHLHRNGGGQKVLVNSLHSRFVFGIFFFQRWRQKVENKNSSEAWVPRSVCIATQRAKNFGKFVVFAVCLWNLLLPAVVRQNVDNKNFSEAWVPRSVCIATQRAKNFGKFVAFAVWLGNLVLPKVACENVGKRNFKGLGFRIGKIGDSGPFYSSYGFLEKKRKLPLRKKMSLGFRVGKFCDSRIL